MRKVVSAKPVRQLDREQKLNPAQNKELTVSYFSLLPHNKQSLPTNRASCRVLFFRRRHISDIFF